MRYLSPRTFSIAVTLSAVVFTGCIFARGGGPSDMTHMHRHMIRSTDIQTGVILGDMDKARDAGRWLASHETQVDLSTRTAPYLDEMRGLGAEVAATDDPATAGMALGRMGAACGGCHAESGGGPRYAIGSGPRGGESVSARMIRHIWGADRMWDGLTGPAPQVWQAGAAALATSWAPRGGTGGQELFQGDAKEALQGLFRIAERARDTEKLADQGELYGELVGYCAQCHQAIGQGLPPSP